MHIKENLDTRQHAILEAIVQEFISHALPVGSRSISKKEAINLSPATIRNVMSDLEEIGFIKQPHTSAGRIPTDMGYRYYVDYLMKQVTLAEEEKEIINSSIIQSNEVEEVLEYASRALGKVTKQLGIALSPKFEEGVFKKMEIVKISANRMLLVLELKSGVVKTITAEMNTELDNSKISIISNILNERLSDKKISDIQETLQERLESIGNKEFLGTIRLFVPSIKHLFDVTARQKLHTGGIPIILSQPEFIDKTGIEAIIELLENKNTLIHTLSGRNNERGTCITIGGENNEGDFSSFSIVTSNYTVGNTSGTLGVIGPTRMPYPKLVSAIDYTVKVLEQNYNTI